LASSNRRGSSVTLPSLQWIPLEKLRVDPRYQREILKQGRKNCWRIAAEFRWTRCSPLVVAKRPNGFYAVIDGQHRAAAAKLHGGIPQMPCLVLQCSVAEEAMAFATINGNVTSLKGLQVFAAQLAAGEPSAVALSEFCARHGVCIPRNSGAALNPGDTLAIGTLKRCFAIYGEAVLGLAISCIVKTGDGNPGRLNAAMLKGLCLALSKNPRWRDNRAALLNDVTKIGLPKIEAAAARVQSVDGGPMHEHVERAFIRAVQKLRELKVAA
jgi:hypothetical protein